MLFWNKSELEFSKCSIQLPYYKPANKFDLVIHYEKSDRCFWYFQEGHVEQLQRFDCCAHHYRHPTLYFSNDRLHICKGIWTPHCDLYDALSIFHLPNGEHHVECVHLPDCSTWHRKVSLFVRDVTAGKI